MLLLVLVLVQVLSTSSSTCPAPAGGYPLHAIANDFFQKVFTHDACQTGVPAKRLYEGDLVRCWSDALEQQQADHEADRDVGR